MRAGGKPPDRERALRIYRIEAATHDADVAAAGEALAAIRRRAVERLELSAGDVVVDVGCGTGLALSLLVDRVGPSGAVVGVEQSPEMIARARQRTLGHAWSNVTLINLPAAEVALSRRADAALFHFTHDILRDPRSLENVLGQLRPGARIVAVGIKWAPWWRLPVNLRVWRLARRYTTTFDGLAEPWSHLARLTADLRWEPLLGGGGYLAWSRAQRGG